MKKNYVLDANVLLHDPHAIFRFEDNDVIIPIYAIEEIDQFKREGSERGRNARHDRAAARRAPRQGGTLATGACCSRAAARCASRSRSSGPSCSCGLESAAQDNAILQTAIDVRDRRQGAGPPSSSRWTPTSRIRADALGVTAETYENQRVTRTPAGRAAR